MPREAKWDELHHRQDDQLRGRHGALEGGAGAAAVKHQLRVPAVLCCMLMLVLPGALVGRCSLHAMPAGSLLLVRQLTRQSASAAATHPSANRTAHEPPRPFLQGGQTLLVEQDKLFPATLPQPPASPSSTRAAVRADLCATIPNKLDPAAMVAKLSRMDYIVIEHEEALVTCLVLEMTATDMVVMPLGTLVSKCVAGALFVAVFAAPTSMHT